MAKTVMSALICLPGPPPPGHPSAAPSPPSNANPDQKGDAPPPPPRPIAVRTTTPIGYVCLGMQGDEKWQQHRHAEIGITIHRDYQGKGYGSEAIEWALRWGFQRANLHRISIGHFAYNEGAGRLYQRVSFLPQFASSYFPLSPCSRFWCISACGSQSTLRRRGRIWEDLADQMSACSSDSSRKVGCGISCGMVSRIPVAPPELCLIVWAPMASEFLDGEYHDMISLSMLDHEWRAKHPKTPAAKQIAQEPAL